MDNGMICFFGQIRSDQGFLKLLGLGHELFSNCKPGNPLVGAPGPEPPSHGDSPGPVSPSLEIPHLGTPGLRTPLIWGPHSLMTLRLLRYQWLSHGR